MELLDLFSGRCHRSSNVIPVHWWKWDYWFLHVFWIVTYLANKHPSLVAGSFCPSQGSPRHLGVKGRKVRTHWLVRRLKWKCSVTQSYGADSGAEVRRGKVVEGLKPAVTQSGWLAVKCDCNTQAAGWECQLCKKYLRERSCRHKDYEGQDFWSVEVVTMWGKDWPFQLCLRGLIC